MPVELSLLELLSPVLEATKVDGCVCRRVPAAKALPHSQNLRPRSWIHSLERVTAASFGRAESNARGSSEGAAYPRVARTGGLVCQDL